MLKAGFVLDGKYRILSIIGQGGMSTVYLAVHERLKQKWAVKEISMEYCENYEMISRKLIVEADILKRLDHPGLPKIVDIIEKKDAIWMVMEFIEGKTLKEILNERGRIEEKEILIWGKQLCEVLSYLHSKKPSIIYRDLKPENIILKKTGRLVLIDFGTAREYCYKNTACDAMYLGTKGYAAPEQYGGMGQTDARTDIYCLGVTLYSLLTGYNPEKPPYKIYPEKYWGEHISLEMKSLLLKCIQSEPEKRYQNCRELAYALSQIDYKKQKEKENERRKIIKFLIFMMVGQLSLMFCIGCKKVSFCYKEEAVVRYINAAEKSEDKKEASQYYKLALELIPEEKLIYQSMVKYFIRLNHFQIEDAVILLDLINSVCEEGAVIEVFQKHNALGYAEFSYALGLGYFYDMGNITGKGASEKWFCEAIDTMTSQDENEAFGKQKRKRAGLYAKIANYYNTFLLNGTDQSGERGTGDFMDFYKTLHSLNQFEVTQKSTKSDLAAAYLISREITIEIMNYAEQFLKDSSINKKMLNKEAFAQMKDGVVILNFARDVLVNSEDIVDALVGGKIGRYVTDFPTPEIAGVKHAIVIPHLGASTAESEDNCAKMAVEELKDFLENGNIRNSVNFPACDMGVRDKTRITILHRNIPNMIGQFTALLAKDNVNIDDMTNKSRGSYAYTMIDVDNDVTEDVVKGLEMIEGVLKVRVIA